MLYGRLLVLLQQCPTTRGRTLILKNRLWSQAECSNLQTFRPGTYAKISLATPSDSFYGALALALAYVQVRSKPFCMTYCMSGTKHKLLLNTSVACLLPIFRIGLSNPGTTDTVFFLFGLTSFVLAGNLQAKIDLNSRATVTSVVRFGDTLGAMIWFLMIGAFSELYSLASAISLFTFIIILACGIGLFYRRKFNI